MRFIGWMMILPILLTGCISKITDSSGSSRQAKAYQDEILGSYVFDLYEGKGLRIISQGSFVIDQMVDDVFTGTWLIKDGPSGNLLCTQNDGLLYIHLNIPGLLPQEYILIGTLDGKSIKGQWRFNVEVFSMEPSGDWFGAVNNNQND
ncbi:hypothetical protein JNM05_02235 [bacterium]|nr:hypothetical protein [bacterium]